MLPAPTPALPAASVAAPVATSAFVSRAPGLAGEPLTRWSGRDAEGRAVSVTIVGGASRRGGVTFLASLGPAASGLGSPGPIAPASVVPGTYTPGSPPGSWDPASLPVRFVPQLADPRDVGSAFVAELDAAIRAWERPSCSGFRAEVAPRAPVTGGDDGVSTVTWHDDAWPSELLPGVLAQTVVHVDAQGHVYDADIHLNGADHRFSLDAAPPGTVDVRGVLTHELGHALGLGHSLDPVATMYASTPDALAWRSLEKDDADGVCALYPGTGIAGCEVGPACPSPLLCFAHVCVRPGERADVCSPCARVVGACAAAGNDARCIDLPSGAGRVCGRACSAASDCGPGFSCLPTTAAGDLQCVADDACASGPNRCAIDADCASPAVCRAGACVGPIEATDAGADASPPPDAGRRVPAGGPSATGGCSLARRGIDADAAWVYLAFAMTLALRRRSLRLAAVLSSLGLGGCAMSGPGPFATTSRSTSPAAPSVPGKCVDAVERLDSTGTDHATPPPLVGYLFDVRVHNPTDGPRWIVLPARFPDDAKETPAPGKGNVDRVTAIVPGGSGGRVVLVEARGPGGFYALKLPPGGRALVHGLPITAAWTSEHATAKLEAIVARELRLDGAPIEERIHGNLVADPDTEIAAQDDPRDVLPVTRASGKDASHGAIAFDEDCRARGQAILKP